MPSRLLVPRIKANVRWVRDSDEHPDDGHFEMYCPDCPKQFNPGAQFHPLTTEFWDPHNMQRCRACNSKRKAERIAQRRRDDPAFRARQVAQSRAIRGYGAQPQEVLLSQPE